MGLNVGLQGKVYPDLVYEVTAEGIRKYAEATNEVNPAFLGNMPVAPPAFPIVAAGESIRRVLFDPELSVDMARLVQGDESHLFHEHLKAGDSLTVTSRLAEVQGGEAGEQFVIVTALSRGEGEVAVELRSRMVIRGSGGRARAAAAQGLAASRGVNIEPPPFAFETTEKVDEDQTFRYAEASGDHNLIHVDEEFARNSAGLPGIICHGMCTMAFAARAVVDAAAGGDPLRLKQIQVEFSRPVFPGQALTTRGWPESEEDSASIYGFETLNPRGQAVLKNGVASVTS